MKGKLRGLILTGLGISLFIALFLSPFASPEPDGLEKVAASEGFSGKAQGTQLSKHAPLLDYSFPWVKNEKVSTGLSVMGGTLAIFFIVMGLGRLLKNRRPHKNNAKP